MIKGWIRTTVRIRSNRVGNLIPDLTYLLWCLLSFEWLYLGWWPRIGRSRVHAAAAAASTAATGVASRYADPVATRASCAAAAPAAAAATEAVVARRVRLATGSGNRAGWREVPVH